MTSEEATLLDAGALESLLGPAVVRALPGLGLLTLAVVAGLVAMLTLRRRLVPARSQRGFRAGNDRPGMGESGRGDWENMLADCKNLRDQGVLSEEEFRKVRTLVDPRTRIDAPELRARHWPPSDPAGPEAART